MNTDLYDLVSLVTEWLTANSKNTDAVFDGEGVVFASSVGSKRNENQDRVCLIEVKRVSKSGGIFKAASVFDGIGGMVDGGGAATLALASWAVYLGAGDSSQGLKSLMLNATSFANDMVYQKYLGRGGTTISAAIFSSQGGVGLNAGDSKLFVMEGNSLSQLSVDDTLSARIAQPMPEVDPWKHPEKIDNRLAQFVGMGEGFDPHLIPLPIRGDSALLPQVLLLTDGAHFVGSDILERLLQKEKKLEAVAKRILNIADWLGSDDNASLAIICQPLKFTSSLPIDATFITIHAFGSALTVFVPPRAIEPQGQLVSQQQALNPVEPQPEIVFGIVDETQKYLVEKQVTKRQPKKTKGRNSDTSSRKKTSSKKHGKQDNDLLLQFVPDKK